MKRMSMPALIITICIPILVGLISATLSANGMETYAVMNKPPLSPPGWVFPVAWTILYVMMGISSYYVFMSEADSHKKTTALVVYGMQLFFNFMWSIIFFNWEAYLAAFIWLIILLVLVVICMIKFYPLNHVASYLLVPYVLWLIFAAYLNMGAYVLKI